MTYEEVRIRLYEMADEKFQKFSSALIPGCKNMIGVRIPKLRLLAKEIKRTGDGIWQKQGKIHLKN
jgi:hypothetical protein